MKKIILIILFTFIMLLCGCSNDSEAVKSENEQLKSKILQLEKDLNDKNAKIIELQNKKTKSLTINYIENTSRKRFVEKQCEILALPTEDTFELNHIEDNTVVTVIDTVSVNNIIWHYVLIPVYDSPCNSKGWLKESDTAPYTKDKVNKVQSDVKVKKDADVYETEDYENIRSAKPYKAKGIERGRILDKKNGYIKLGCPGGLGIWVIESSIIYPEPE